jgi:hypothetical protein
MTRCALRLENRSSPVESSASVPRSAHACSTTVISLIVGGAFEYVRLDAVKYGRDVGCGHALCELPIVFGEARDHRWVV